MFPIPPVRIDIFAVFIFLGVCQGFFLSYLFLTHKSENAVSNRLLGLLLLSLSLVTLDVWLGYTDYMGRMLWLVDSTEPLNLLISPLLYLYINSRLSEPYSSRQRWHFLPAGLYFVYMCVLVYPQSLAYKYNAYMGAFHPELPEVPVSIYGYNWMFWPKNHINELTLLQMAVYITLCLVEVKTVLRERNLSFFSRKDPEINWVRHIVLQLTAVGVLFFMIRSTFRHDLGDHIIAAHMAFVLYAVSFSLLRQSVVFHSGEKAETPQVIEEKLSEPIRKYEKSSLTPEIESYTLQKLYELMEVEKPFLKASFSMPDLARQLSVAPHHLSQILNDRLQQNFFEFTATYRIKEAQRLLCQIENQHVRIEEIAEQVGYNSKSSFNTAFKKLTGMTPSEYRHQQMQS